MALIQYTDGPPIWPDVHSRSYYPTTHEKRPTLRRYKRKHVPARRHANPYQMTTFGRPFAENSRLWFGHAEKLWTSLSAADKQFWEDTALANPATNYKLVNKIFTGFQFFLMYQRAMMNTHGLNWLPFNPVFMPSAYMCTQPWAWADTPEIQSIIATAPYTLTITLPNPPVGTDNLIALYFSPTPGLPAWSIYPEYQANKNGSWADGFPPYEYTLQLQHIYSPKRPGKRCKVGVRVSTMADNYIGIIKWSLFSFAP